MEEYVLVEHIREMDCFADDVSVMVFREKDKARAELQKRITEFPKKIALDEWTCIMKDYALFETEDGDRYEWSIEAHIVL